MESSIACLYTPRDVSMADRVDYWTRHLASTVAQLEESERVLIYEVVTPGPRSRSLRAPRLPDAYLEVKGVGADGIIGLATSPGELPGVEDAMEWYSAESHEIIPPDTQRPGDFVMLYVMYRWHGKSKDQFRDHYLNVHAVLGSKVPGLKWYDVNLTQPDGDAETMHPPAPDAFTFCAYDSESVFAESLKSPEIETAMADDEDFCGAYFDCVVRRHNIKA